MFLTKLDTYSKNEYETNVYNYSYLSPKTKDRVCHFVSEKDLKYGNEIAGSKAYICKKGEEFESHFDQNYDTEMYHIAKISIRHDEDKNKGIMTIIMCDILLAILNREFAWGKNIEVSLTDRSKVIVDGIINTSVSVYSHIFRGYRKGINISEDRLVVDDIYMYYLFPIKTRKDDIKYYQNLRNEKIERFKNRVLSKEKEAKPYL